MFMSSFLAPSLCVRDDQCFLSEGCSVTRVFATSHWWSSQWNTTIRLEAHVCRSVTRLSMSPDLLLRRSNIASTYESANRRMDASDLDNEMGWRVKVMCYSAIRRPQPFVWVQLNPWQDKPTRLEVRSIGWSKCHVMLVTSAVSCRQSRSNYYV